MEHVSVLKQDVEKYLDLRKGEIVVDATLGLGGHAQGILEEIGTSGKLIAFEQDERNLAEAKRKLEKYKEQTTYINDNFRYLKNRITGSGFDQVDAVLFDLGLSSPHVDDPERGFSFSKEGPLDMRFNPNSKLTAYEVINSYPEDELVKIFFEYGEERMARKVARLICEDRKEKPFETTIQFAEFLERILRKSRASKSTKSHPATQIFQAIRIEVNDELNALKEALEQTVDILKVGGRAVVISYHSVEDRVVKQFFKAMERPEPTPEESVYQTHGEPIVKILTKKPVIPSKEEIEKNPRSRSAKLRAYEKIRQP